jgi:agmatinase
MNNIVFISCDKEYKDSDIVIQGAPFDGTVSFRPGTRFAPNVIRIDSDGLETYSPYQNQDIEDLNICDMGDSEVTHGSKFKTLDTLYEDTKKYLKDGKKVLTIGGEHLISLSPIKAYYEEYKDLRIIHFDAHTDLRNDYMGEELSHATVLKRVTDFLGKDKLYQFGIRSGLKEEFEFASNNHYIEKFKANTIGDIIDEIKDFPIYITLDLDVLDPSIMPGTGTPEPGGLTFNELLDAILKLKGLNIVGVDVVELSPQYDLSGASNAVAGKLIRELLLML